MRSILYLRADGGPKIGLGHLVRCMALAEMLENEFEAVFVCREIPDHLAEELVQKKMNLVKIAGEEEFFELLRQGSVVVTDGYHFDTSYQDIIKGEGCRLVCIDDLHQEHFVADLIINHAPGITSEKYSVESYTDFALGFDYALLRPPFLAKKTVAREISQVTRAFVCFGGADINNLTLITLSALLPVSELKEIVVVSGSEYQYADKIERLVRDNPRVIHYKSVNAGHMADLLSVAHLAIVPASTIAIEALACKTLMITGTTAANQEEILDGLKAYSFVTSIGDFNNCTQIQMESVVRKLLEDFNGCYFPPFSSTKELLLNKFRNLL